MRSAGNIRVSVPDSCRAAIGPYSGKQITLGIRPEHLRLVDRAESSGLNPQHSVVIAVATEAVERLGAESHVNLKAGGLSLVARVESGIEPEVGRQVLAAVFAEHLHFFDTASEAAINTPGTA